MNTAEQNFSSSIAAVKNIFPIYDHTVNALHLPIELTSDILRSQIVYAVSALDRLIHELVRIGILEIFKGVRKPTSKFENQPFKASTLVSIMSSLRTGAVPTTPEDVPEFIINRELTEKLGFLAFQAPDKVKDALSYIWNESRKSVILAKEMGLNGSSDNDLKRKLEQTLELIVTRRNQIAHEADYDSSISQRRPITRTETEIAVEFIENLGMAICRCVAGASCLVSPTSP